MKKRIALFFAGIVLFVFIFITSIAWSRIFFNEEEVGDVTILNIEFSDEHHSIVTTQVAPLEEPIETLEPYQFRLTNTSSHNSHYQLLLEEDPISNKIGYRQEDLLTREQLNYELSLNGSVIKKAKLSTIKNNVLDDRVIQGNKENRYTLKVWVHDQVKAGEWENKYYHYKVTVKVIGE